MGSMESNKFKGLGRYKQGGHRLLNILTYGRLLSWLPYTLPIPVCVYVSITCQTLYMPQAIIKC